MQSLIDAFTYLTSGASWSGADGLGSRLGEHLLYSVLALALACFIAIPLGLWTGHTGRGGALVVNVGNAGRAVPTFAVLVLFVLMPPPFGANLFSYVLALALFSLPPLLTNTYTGVREVDRSVVDAARGMGLSGRQVLRDVEVPLARPLMVSGFRLAAVQVIATATVLGLVGGGGLGRTITTGFAVQDQGMVIGSALLVALVALLVEWLLEQAQRRSAARPG